MNRTGFLVVHALCKKHGVPKLVFSSSPSTRFTGADVDGLREDEMPSLPLPSYLQEYAGTKAAAELEVSKACCDDLLTVSVAPHQVYGPRDNLFLPNLLENAGNGRLAYFVQRAGQGKIATSGNDFVVKAAELDVSTLRDRASAVRVEVTRRARRLRKGGDVHAAL